MGLGETYLAASLGSPWRGFGAETPHSISATESLVQAGLLKSKLEADLAGQTLQIAGNRLTAQDRNKASIEIQKLALKPQELNRWQKVQAMAQLSQRLGGGGGSSQSSSQQLGRDLLQNIVLDPGSGQGPVERFAGQSNALNVAIGTRDRDLAPANALAITQLKNMTPGLPESPAPANIPVRPRSQAPQLTVSPAPSTSAPAVAGTGYSQFDWFANLYRRS
jgi:hypothetical protein